jgi:hypothetical protein
MNKSQVMQLVLVVTIANYIAQIPYYFHQYYSPYKTLPSLAGSMLLGITLIWFLIGYIKTAVGQLSGYYLLLSFLIVEFLFYLQTQISQLLISHQLFLHVLHPNGIVLLLVFGIGYLNFFASAFFIYYLLFNRRLFVDNTQN